MLSDLFKKEIKETVNEICKVTPPKIKKDEDFIYKQVCNLIENKKNIFITGGGGVGKSYMLNKLRRRFDITVTSTTGVSALNVKGQTVHSWSGIGIANKDITTIVKKIKDNKRKLKQIQSTRILAIDEISMLDDYTLDYLNTVLKEVMGSYKPFGGLQVILIGDFFQLPPVKINEFKTTKPIDFCFNSKTWKELRLETIYLKKVYRQTDKKLIETLNNIREGNIEDTSIFDKCSSKPIETAIRLYATNDEVDTYNMYKYNQIDEKEYIYEAEDLVSSFVKGSYRWVSPYSKDTPEQDKLIFSSFSQNCKAPGTLTLKIGARVMLLQNIDVERGLVNGSCGTVIDLDNFLIEVKFDNGIRHIFEKNTFELEYNGFPKTKRTQYPLMLAWAVSIHKSQGCTFDNVFIDFKRIFTFGQAYVALSRVKTLDGLYLQNFDATKIKANPRVIEFYKRLEDGEKS